MFPEKKKKKKKKKKANKQNLADPQPGPPSASRWQRVSYFGCLKSLFFPFFFSVIYFVFPFLVLCFRFEFCVSVLGFCDSVLRFVILF